MRFERHAHQRKSESRAIVFGREVRLEHAVAQVRWNAWSVIGDRDGETGGVARDVHVDRPPALHRFSRVAIQIRERPAQRLVMAEDRTLGALRRELNGDAVGHARAPQFIEQFDEVDFTLRPLRQPAELGEFFRKAIEAIGLRRQYLKRRFRPSGRPAVHPSELIHGDAHRRQRVLDFVRHAPRHFTECAQPLGFELARAGGGQCRRQLAQRLPQGVELGRAASQECHGQCLTAPDEQRPSDQLVDGTRQLAREVTSELDGGVQHGGAEQHDHEGEAGRVIAEERLGASRQADRRRYLIEMVPEQRPLAHREVQGIDAFEQRAGRCRHTLRRCARARCRQQSPDRQHPPRHGEHRGDRRHHDEDEEDSPPKGKRHIWRQFRESDRL